jgi:DNA-binding transcriptional ArsR family regulator
MSQVEALSPARMKDAAPLFAALGDVTRLAVLVSLCSGGPLTVTGLSRQFAVSRQAITKHLEVLSEARLVSSVRRGRERIWALEPKRIEEAHQYLERLSREWDVALGRLKAFVEA